MNRLVLVGPLLAFAWSFGCASYPSPQQHLADSIAAVRGAQEVGAASQPQAALNLKLAQEEVEQAKALLSAGDNERADFMTLRAKSDADLALVLVKEQSARIRAQRIETSAQAVENGATVVPVAPVSPVLPRSTATVSPSGTGR